MYIYGTMYKSGFMETELNNLDGIEKGCFPRLSYFSFLRLLSLFFVLALSSILRPLRDVKSDCIHGFQTFSHMFTLIIRLASVSNDSR